MGQPGHQMNREDLMLCQDQAQADIPYVPPESAKNRAVWMWSKDGKGGLVSEM